jgi:glutamate synthase domain-containing protein 1
MCRLFSLTSTKPLSPFEALKALDVMREGHDGSGVGLFLRELGGKFKEFENLPILSGIFTKNGLNLLDDIMKEKNFQAVYDYRINTLETPCEGIPKRDSYLIRVYNYPPEWRDMSENEKKYLLMLTRLELKQAGMENDDIIVFSFWPDAVMIKEIGDPLKVGKYLKLDSSDEILARTIMAQGRQNTNYAINLYACHPFFVEGYATMTNGENTAFVPIKEYLSTRGFEGYCGFQSDSEVFVHILHYTMEKLGLGLDSYKHIITPLSDDDMNKHSNQEFLKHLKQTCRRLIIDGPNCVIGSLPDSTMFMVQDRKKLRPGVVGGRKGIFAFSSELCGLDSAIPERDKSKDFQPMHLDTAIVDKNREEVKICRQTDQLVLPN